MFGAGKSSRYALIVPMMRSKFLGATLMRHVPGFEKAILQMQQQSAGCLQAVTSADRTPTPSGIATPRLSGS